jgi:hypothetical protein
MMREQLEIAAFGGRELLQPIGMNDDIRSGERRVRQLVPNGLLEAAVLGVVIGVGIIGGPMDARKQIRLIADFECQQTGRRAGLPLRWLRRQPDP